MPLSSAPLDLRASQRPVARGFQGSPVVPGGGVCTVADARVSLRLQLRLRLRFESLGSRGHS